MVCIICSQGYIIMFYRVNFSLEELASASPYYTHFRQCLESVYPAGSRELKFSSHQIQCDFPQYFHYDRVKELVEL